MNTPTDPPTPATPVASSDRPRVCGPGRGLWGPIVLIGVGILFLLDQFHIVAADLSFSLVWSLVLIFFGVRVAANPRRQSTWLGAVLVLIGVVVGLRAFGVIAFGMGRLWPLILVVAGIALILTPRPRSRAPIFVSSPWTQNMDPTGNSVDITAVFGGAKQRITSQQFQGGQITAVCGGFQLDLTGANFDGDTCVINISTFCGGGEIRLPPGWLVSFEGQTILGGYSDETHTFPGYTPPQIKRLVIRGVALMGGVQVKN